MFIATNGRTNERYQKYNNTNTTKETEEYKMSWYENEDVLIIASAKTLTGVIGL